MDIPIIYADFNTITSSKRNKFLLAVPLDTYGSLKDLTNKQVKLREGMRLVIYSDSSEGEDLETDCIVYYDSKYKWWMAEFDRQGIRYVPSHTDLWSKKEFHCLQCQIDLEPFFREHGRSPKTRCPNCGLSIMAAILPPTKLK